jgi:hypothetical protein
MPSLSRNSDSISDFSIDTGADQDRLPLFLPFLISLAMAPNLSVMFL